MSSYWPLHGGLACYAMFVAVCLAVGFAKTRSPIQEFCYRHALAFPFAAGVLAYLASRSGADVNEGGLGVLLGLGYFTLVHYAVGLQLFGVAQRSVSTNLLVALLRKGGECTVSDLKQSYGGGKSLGFVTQSRLAQMERWGWIEGSATTVRASPRGRLRARASGFALAALGLRPMETPRP